MKREHLIWPEEDVASQAAYWMTVMSSERVSDVDQKAFQHWLNADITHEKTYQSLLENWRICDDLSDDIDLLEMRRQALIPTSKQNPWRRFLAVAAVFLFAVITTVITFNGTTKTDGVTVNVQITGPGDILERPVLLSTAIGERSTMNLEDGSTVELNTNTVINVKFTETERTLYLVKGQALFSVAHNAERPFVVYAGQQRITALGTEFEVRIDNEDVAVTLITGAVKVDELVVDDQQDTPVVKRSVELLPGQRLNAQTAAPENLEEEKLGRALSWRKGRLEFKNESLREIVYEINRYSERKVILGDPGLMDLRISGSFKAGSVENFATALISVHSLAREDDPQKQQIIIRWKS